VTFLVYEMRLFGVMVVKQECRYMCTLWLSVQCSSQALLTEQKNQGMQEVVPSPVAQNIWVRTNMNVRLLTGCPVSHRRGRFKDCKSIPRSRISWRVDCRCYCCDPTSRHCTTTKTIHLGSNILRARRNILSVTSSIIQDQRDESGAGIYGNRSVSVIFVFMSHAWVCFVENDLKFGYLYQQKQYFVMDFIW
jgi:hypothetical protein